MTSGEKISREKKTSLQTGAAGLLIVAVLLPLLGIMLTISMEITNYFSALHLAQEMTDRAILEAEKVLPDVRAAETILRAHFRNFTPEIPNLSGLTMTSVTYEDGILQVKADGLLDIFGLGLAGLFSAADRAGKMPLQISSAARSQSIDLLLILDGFQTPLIDLGSRGAEGSASCPGSGMVPALDIMNSLLSRVSELPLNRVQVILTPYNGQTIYPVFPETVLHPDSQGCKGLIRKNTQYSRILEQYLLTAPELTRPHDPSFIGAASAAAFLSGGESLIKLKDPIHRTIFYVPASGAIPEKYSAEALISSVLTSFESVRRLAKDMREKTEIVVLVPVIVGEGPSLSQILRGGDSGSGVSVKIIEAPVDLGAQSDLSSLLTSSLHSGVLSR